MMEVPPKGMPLTRWALRIVVLLLVVLALLVFFRVERRDGAVMIVPRTAEQRRALWPFGREGQDARATPPAVKRQAPRAPEAPPEDRLNRRDRQALENLLEEEMQ